MASRRHDSRSDDFADVLRQIDDEVEESTSREWDELADQVTLAAIQKMLNPARPLVKIGRFDAQVAIGRGGFGMVFKAHDPELRRFVALKLCRARNADAIEGLMDEARVLARLTHPNIVTVFEPGRHEDAVFFAMQYIDGQNARDFGNSDPPPTWQEVVDVYCGAGRGLAAAHDEGIRHGDVKPSNILLDRDHFSRIADFGLAQKVIEDADECEQEGLRRRAGTLHYMAPEVLRGEPGDALSDQWSFCVSLCETLTGELPFWGTTSAELLDEIEHADVQFEDASIPDELRAVLRIGLSIDPRDRFPDMHALVAELDRLRQSPPSLPPSAESEPELGEEPEPEPEPPEHDAAELRPTGGAEPTGASKAKRGAFAVSLLVGLVCMTIGWMGRGQLAAEVPRVSEPIPLPAPSPCAVDESAATMPVSAGSVLIVTCSRIRAGKLLEATRLWDVEFFDRRHPKLGANAPNDEDLALLRAETLIVARTFVDQAERLHRWAWVTGSIRWSAHVLRRPVPDDPTALATDYAENWTRRVEGPDPEDPDLRSIRDRIDRLRD